MVGTSDCPRFIWKRAEKDFVEVCPLFEFVDFELTCGDTPLARHVYETLLSNSKDGEGSIINQRSILQMRVEREEVP